MIKKLDLKKLITNVITFTILGIALYFAYQFYKINNFNDFIKSEAKINTSEFKRDKEIKYSNSYSYKITSDDFNDAMFSKEIKVEKNKPYKIKCMVKTEGVSGENNNEDVGAQISITDTTERSVAISGDSEWQEIELVFNSKNRETVDVAFRLGGVEGKAKGIAWFSDFSCEQGVSDNENNWNFGCFIFDNTKVNINNNEVNIQMTKSDVKDIKDTIKRFEKSCKTLSKEKMTAQCDIYEIENPITELSYDDEFGYYVSPENVENQIKDIINNNNYDHIFIIVRLGNEEYENEIEIKDWIGLGAMDYYGIGFSNIRLPNSSKSYIYKYSQKINQFPEEVFLHEFLHSLERTSTEYGYQIPELHAYEKYGYKNENLIGQKKWYQDYMNKEINTNSGKIGLPEEVYKYKPPKKSDFLYPYKLDYYKEPQNIIEEIKGIFKNLYRNVELILEKI